MPVVTTLAIELPEITPVNADEIKLPTDGFRNPNAAQQIFGNMENSGQSGGSRPLPSAAPDQGGQPPKVGDLDVPARLQNPNPSGGDKKSKKKGNRTADASGATPGFDLN